MPMVNRLVKQLTRMIRVGRVPVLMLPLLASTGSRPPDPFGTGAGELQCTWTEGARKVLTFPDGTEAYVEPASLVHVDGGAALFGIPNYQFPPGEYRFVRDSLFGALIGWDLSARPVLPPSVEGELYGHSAVQTEDGALLVGFAVIRPGTGWPLGTIADRIGIGRYSAGGWGPMTWVTRSGLQYRAGQPGFPSRNRTSSRLHQVRGRGGHHPVHDHGGPSGDGRTPSLRTEGVRARPDPQA